MQPNDSLPKVPFPSRRYLWRLKRQQLLRSDAPILVGPFRTEIGFEALYWIPFIERLKADGIDPARLIPISRGGASVWYNTPTGLELFAMRTPQQVRVENRLQREQYHMLKQMRVTAFDRAVLRDAAATLGLRRYQTLHPAWMYQAFDPFWDGRRGMAWLERQVQFTHIPPPPLPGTLQLPEAFVAMRWYLRPTFPASELVGSLVSACIQRVAAQIPVILLHHDLYMDDHRDVIAKTLPPNVYRLQDLAEVNTETHLAVQSAILARARAFVGTYGGFAQLALRFGRPVVSFYEGWGGTAFAHKHLTDALAILTRTPFQVWSIHEIALAQTVLPVVLPKTTEAPAPTPAGVY